MLAECRMMMMMMMMMMVTRLYVTFCCDQPASLEDSYVVTSSEDKVRASRSPLLSDARIQTSRKVSVYFLCHYLFTLKADYVCSAMHILDSCIHSCVFSFPFIIVHYTNQHLLWRSFHFFIRFYFYISLFLFLISSALCHDYCYFYLF